MQFIEQLESRYFLSANILPAHEPLALSAGLIQAHVSKVPDARGTFVGTVKMGRDRDSITIKIIKQRNGQFTGTVTSQGKSGARFNLSGSINRLGKITLNANGRTKSGPAWFTGTGQLSGNTLSGRITIHTGDVIKGSILLTRA